MPVSCAACAAFLRTIRSYSGMTDARPGAQNAATRTASKPANSASSIFAFAATRLVCSGALSTAPMNSGAPACATPGAASASAAAQGRMIRRTALIVAATLDDVRDDPSGLTKALPFVRASRHTKRRTRALQRRPGVDGRRERQPHGVEAAGEIGAQRHRLAHSADCSSDLQRHEPTGASEQRLVAAVDVTGERDGGAVLAKYR